MTDLIDQHQPDLVYTDGGAFDGVGLEAVAHYYNANLQWHKGDLQGVYTLKDHTAAGPEKYGDYREGAATLDVAPRWGVAATGRGAGRRGCDKTASWLCSDSATSAAR